MAEFSDNSDVNSDEIAQIVDDIDNLDNILLNDSFKKLPQHTKKDIKDSRSRLSSESKKKVMFQDFNEDDPLADLLAEDGPQTKKKDAARNKSNIMEDLFGIKSSESVPNIGSSDKILNPIISTPSVPTARQTRTSANLDSLLDLKDTGPRESYSQSHVPRARPATSNEDVTSSFPDKSKPTDDRSKKSSLMEDLFGTKTTSSQNLSTRRSTTRLAVETPAPQSTTDEKPNAAAQERSVRSQAGGYAPTFSTPRESRRGRRTSGIINDPLGLLSSSLPPEQTLDTAGPPRKESFTSLKSTTETFQNDNLNKPQDDLPEWLGGTKKADEKKQTTKDSIMPNLDQNEVKDKVRPSVVAKIQQSEDKPNSKEIDTQRQSNEDAGLYSEQFSILTRTQIDQQAAIMTMQQQEHELRTAVTLSRQNSQLSQLLEVQRSKLSEQEKQFNLLVQKQIERQTLLESQMKVQQNRIEHYIQTLMAQPTSLPITVTLPGSTNFEDEKKESNEKDTDKEAELLQQIQKLETEKTSLEYSLKNLNDKHENELIVQEKLYTRQVSFLEEAIEKMEKRMRQEIECLEADNEAKIEKLREEKTQIEQYYKSEIENIKRDHILFIEEIHKRHSLNLKLLQKEHAETIENIAKAKELDDVAMRTIANHKTDLENVIQRATVVLDTCKTVYEKIEQKDDNLDRDKDSLFRNQQEELKIQRNYVERQVAFVEKAHNELIKVAQKLDTYVNQFATESERQNVRYTETEACLIKKEQQLIHEREQFEEKLKWERNNLQIMKESWIKEQERQLKALAEEREAVLVEKTKVEVINRLQIGADDVKKIEIESITKAAQDAITYANQERLNWRNKINELESQQRQLQDKENQLLLRAKELENLTQAALVKRNEGVRALKEAKYLENRYKEKLGTMQNQLEAIAQRENKIATEKFTLARERLALRVLEKPERDTKKSISQKQDDPLLLPQRSLMSTSHFTDIVDPHLILLKLDLEKQLATSNKYLNSMHT